MEAEAARDLGLTMSQWDDLDEHDRAYAMALRIAEIEDETHKCPQCGRDPAECQDADNQHAYEVSFRRCYRREAIEKAEAARAKKTGGKDFEGVMAVATLNPAKKKSARPTKG